jgi:hypothetical protein
VNSVETPGIAAIQLVESLRKTSVRGLDDQVIVVSHQAVGQTRQLVTLNGPAEPFEEFLSILVEQKKRSPIAAS